MRFQQWHNFNSSDTGRVQIKAGMNDWQTLATYTSTSSGVWNRPDLNLRTYVGQTVRIGFLFTSSTTPGVINPVRVGPGWYIDEVRLLHDFALLLGSTIVRTQETACVPLEIAMSSPASTVSFVLPDPVGQLSNLVLNAEGCWTGTMTSEANSRWLITLENSCPAAPMGVKTIGSICFAAVSAHSAFVPLVVNDLEASVSPAHPFDGRAVVIANEPLLEAWMGTNQERMATLYGKADRMYEIRYTNNLVCAQFSSPSNCVVDSSLWPVALTNTVPASLFSDFPLTGALSNAPSLYLHARER
jgi:hypothetical protein